MGTDHAHHHYNHVLLITTIPTALTLDYQIQTLDKQD